MSQNLAVLQLQQGRAATALNVIAAALIKGAAGFISQINVVLPGTTSGALTINDAASIGGAAAANVLFTIGFAGLSVGQIILLNMPFFSGLVVSAVPGAGTPQYTIVYA